MPLIPGISYPITNSLTGPLTISDNQSSAATLFSYAWAHSNNVIIQYSFVRGGIYAVGNLLVATDGTTISDAQSSADLMDAGIMLEFALSGPNVLVQYTSTSTGQSGQFWYSVQHLSS